MKFLASTVTGDGTISVTLEHGTSYVVATEHPAYMRLLKAFKAKDVEKFVEEYDAANAFNNFVGESSVVTIKDETVLYKGNEIHNSLTQRIIDLMRDGFDVMPMVKFLENLMKNPSKNSVDQLYDFLAHKHLPITDDGCFLAYKSVRSDYYSVASGNLTLLKGKTDGNGRIYNGVGEEILCERNEVDDNPSNHCSKGLHVGALSYAGPNGWYHNDSQRVVVVKVNPMNAVSVPSDHSYTKLRTCGYTVVTDFKEALTRSVYQADCNESFEVCDLVEDEIDDLWDEVDIRDLVHGDAIKFTYVNKEDVQKVRYARVESVEDDYISCSLLTSDPSFHEHEFASFNVDRMSNIQYLE